MANLKNARQFVMLIWMMCQSNLKRYFQSQRVLKLVKVTNNDPKTLYLVLECQVVTIFGMRHLVKTLICDRQTWEFEV